MNLSLSADNSERATVSSPAPMIPVPYRVRHVHRESHDTFSLELKPVHEGSHFSFQPGQFNMLYAFGVGEVPISISGDPRPGPTLVHTVRAVGPVTQTITRLHVGQQLGVRGPFGRGWPVEEAVGKDLVLVAGGLGLPPLRSVIYQVMAERERFGQVSLLYGARNPAELVYLREVAQWRSRFDITVEVTVDAGNGAWRGPVGVVTTLIPRARFQPENTVAMICGPEIMMRFTLLELEKRGVNKDRLFLSMERNMKCGMGQCGHCQLGPWFVCKDGPVFDYQRISPWFGKAEV
jgi:NAD(P)H-flavin reductase